VKSATQTAAVSFNAGAGEDRVVDTNIQTSIDLPPGEYEIRMGVEEPSSGKVASAFIPVTVPDFAAAPVSLSDVMIHASGAIASGATSQPTLSPTTRRVFGRDELVNGIFQVYQGTARTSALVPIGVRNRVIDAAGHTVRDQSLTLTPSQFERRTAALSVNLDDLEPGAYVLSLETSSGSETAQRQVPFRIR
jgi:hypothetical protein